MDLNVAVSTASELFEDNDMVFPILMGRENLKILASPGSESSGVSSLDAEEAKKLGNERLPPSSTPIMTSEPSSTVQTESESSDGSSDADDDKPSEQSPCDSVQSADEKETESGASDDEDKSVDHSANENCVERDVDDLDADLATTVAASEDLAAIDLDEIRYKTLKIVYDGRDILDFGANVANKSWSVQYAHLPEKNYQMYINNRSQYNRLSAGYESPENYALNKCAKCAFHFPVMVDIPDKGEQPSSAACKADVSELLTSTVSSIVSRQLPTPTMNVLAQKLNAPMACSHTPPTGGHSINLNNFMMNGNSTAAGIANIPPSPYAYQSQSQSQNQNRNQFANVNLNGGNNNNSNNHNCFKQNNTANSYYGNNMVLNALVNQIGNMNNSSAFNSNFANAINGTNNTNPLNTLGNAALTNLMNQNRQQLFGMCRQNINKSGINFNANSHKSMPTYSHF